MTHDIGIIIFVGPLVGNIAQPQYQLPVTPEVVTISDSTQLTRSRVIGIGEIAQIGSHNLKRFTINSFFPRFYDTYTTEHFNHQAVEHLPPGLIEDFIETQQTHKYFPSPLIWVERFLSMRDIPLKIVMSGINVDEDFIMNNFTYSSVGGEGEDIQYSASFVEHKPLSIRAVDFGQPGDPIQVHTFVPFVPGSSLYEVNEGDTWARIHQITGVTPQEIMRINDITNAFFLQPGVVLLLVGDTLHFPVLPTR